MSFTDERIDILIEAYTDLRDHNKRLVDDEFYGEIALGKFKAYSVIIGDLIRLKNDLRKWEAVKP